MNRRSFIGTVAGVTGLSTAALACSKCEQGTPVPHPSPQPKGPYMIEIILPSEDAGRELPLFDTYKSAENFAAARMNLYRQAFDYIQYEAGLIKVWSADNQVVYECSWGQSWTQATSYVDCHGRLT
tara:strand:+ start:938 stop:1315 length:378 start_codon:yes stop_codon:yes gene_type:complete